MDVVPGGAVMSTPAKSRYPPKSAGGVSGSCMTIVSTFWFDPFPGVTVQSTGWPGTAGIVLVGSTDLAIVGSSVVSTSSTMSAMADASGALSPVAVAVFVTV